jgi:hypothetical protein
MKPPGPKTTRTVDVRGMIARGESPFSKIMQAVAQLGPSDDLVLVTPFLPSPLIEKLGSEGFHARPERSADGSWRTQFSRG